MGKSYFSIRYFLLILILPICNIYSDNVFFHHDTEEKLAELQGTWHQFDMYPRMSYMIGKSLPLLHVALETFIDFSSFSSRLTIKSTEITITSTQYSKEFEKYLDVFTAKGILETKNSMPVEINSHWLFKTPYNPFLYCFSQTILTKIFKTNINLEQAYINLDRIKFTLLDKDSLVVTIYPNRITKIEKIELSYKKQT